MHRLLHSKLLITLILFTVGCDDSDEVTLEGVKTSVVGESVVIENNHGKAISYFAVEEETAQLINWAAISGDENTVAHRASKTIPWNDIMSDGSLTPGDRVIIYWWLAQDSISTSTETKQNIVTL